MFKTSRKNNEDKLLQEFGNLKNDSFYFKWIAEYFNQKDNSGAFQALSEKTCNDIDFQELFMFLDRTNSKVGQQYLYHKLRAFSSTTSEVAVDEKIISELTAHPDFRISIQKELSKLNHTEAYYITALFQDEHVNAPKWLFAMRLLSFTSILSLAFLFFNSAYIFVLLAVFIINSGIHYWNKKIVYQYLGSLPQLLKLHSIAHELYKKDILKEVNPDISKALSTIDGIKKHMY